MANFEDSNTGRFQTDISTQHDTVVMFKLLVFEYIIHTLENKSKLRN